MDKVKIIDLTMPLDEKTPAYVGDPQIEIKQIALLKKNGWNEKRINSNTHCGTHIDAPSHMLEGKNLDQLQLELFYGEGIVIDVRRRNIDEQCIPNQKLKDKIVLFLTGQSDKRYDNYYQSAKFIPTEVALKLEKEKVKAVGIDSFSPDEEPYPVHKILLPQNILIIENLIDLKLLLQKKFIIHYFPLRITKGDGAPCRAIAFVK